ncbi:MAG: RNA polymerase sigma factor [Oscillospiraceae bacterium]|nr:RNA polymerase sigma factor [Oscillospiraceae bacterium]
MIEDEGDRSKFLRIYNTYRNMMYGIAVKILENEQDAEDAVHQAFLAIIEHLDDVKEEDVSRTKAFTAVITERKAIDIIRARAKFVDTHLEDTAGGIEVAYEGENDLARAMARLNPRYREALLLRYDSGYSTKEIARMMGLSRGTAQKLIWRAKEALRKELEKEGQDE